MRLERVCEVWNEFGTFLRCRKAFPQHLRNISATTWRTFCCVLFRSERSEHDFVLFNNCSCFRVFLLDCWFLFSLCRSNLVLSVSQRFVFLHHSERSMCSAAICCSACPAAICVSQRFVCCSLIWLILKCLCIESSTQHVMAGVVVGNLVFHNQH